MNLKDCPVYPRVPKVSISDLFLDLFQCFLGDIYDLRKPQFYYSKTTILVVFGRSFWSLFLYFFMLLRGHPSFPILCAFFGTQVGKSTPKQLHGWSKGSPGTPKIDPRVTQGLPSAPRNRLQKCPNPIRGTPDKPRGDPGLHFEPRMTPQAPK